MKSGTLSTRGRYWPSGFVIGHGFPCDELSCKTLVSGCIRTDLTLKWTWLSTYNASPIQSKVVPSLFVKGPVLNSDSEAVGERVQGWEMTMVEKGLLSVFTWAQHRLLTRLCDQINHGGRFPLAELMKLSFQQDHLTVGYALGKLVSLRTNFSKGRHIHRDLHHTQLASHCSFIVCVFQNSTSSTCIPLIKRIAYLRLSEGLRG